MALKESNHSRILRILTERTLALPAGTKFSTEYELCAEFGVSRMTISKVIDTMAADGYLFRSRPKGTFVCEKIPLRQVVTFLLPCPDALTRTGYVSIAYRNLFSGALEAAHEGGARLETVALSPTNDPTNIDLSVVNHLKPGSPVLVPNEGFFPLFGRLAKRDCKVILLNWQTLYSDRPKAKYAQKWPTGKMDRRQATYELTCRLYRRGCRRIALMSPYLYEPKHPISAGYHDAIRTHHLEEFIFDQKSSATVDKLVPEELRFLSENRCDAVVLNATHMLGITGESLNDCLGVHGDIQVGAMRFQPEYNRIRRNPLHYKFDEVKIGYDSVKRLLAGQFEPQEILYPADLYEEGEIATGKLNVTACRERNYK